jgi:uncharacterized membrane protein YgcG
MKRIGLSLAVLLIIIATSNVQAAEVPPAPDEEGVWVIDSAQVLSSSEFDILNNKCNEIYLESGKPIVILTIESYQEQGAEGWDEEQYARFAFDEYGINDDNNDNKAILIFMSEQDRQFRIELGGGYAGEWNWYVQEVFDYDVRPYLSENMWYEGLRAAVEGMDSLANQGEITFPNWEKVSDDSSANWIIDEAGLIVDVDENDINLRINDIEKNTNCSILIVTIDGLSGKNASFIGGYEYADKAFENYNLNECDILWIITKEYDAWDPMYYWWDINTKIGSEYEDDWRMYLDSKQWEIFDELEWGGGEVDDFLLHDIVDYSEKAILNDGFEMDEWIEINTQILVLLLILIALPIGIFMRSIPKKIRFRKEKDEALENIALVNRNIMANIDGNSSIRNNWNGKFKGMTDSEIKSFRRLDDKLSKNDIEISLEKYENELKQIREVYNLRTNKSNFIVLIILFGLVIPLSSQIGMGLMSSQFSMEAKVIEIGVFQIITSIPFLIIPYIFIIRPLKSMFGNLSGNMKDEMGLILGIPIMSSKSSLPSLGASGRYNMSEYEYDRLHSFNEQDYHWTYGGMERSGNSFRGSSGFTSSERASSSSDGGGGGGGGGGGFDSGGSGGGGGGGGDF